MFYGLMDTIFKLNIVETCVKVEGTNGITSK
jgi:hypothetical protein